MNSQILIKPIEHVSIPTSKQIYGLFQRSYAVEAELLGHPDFPPLKRTAADIRESSNSFYGFYSKGVLSGVVELETHENHIHIRSLTVDPAYFRKKIATQLLDFVKNRFQVDLLTVETGHANHPAVTFYLNFGFKKHEVFMTEVGIEKISFEMKRKQ